MPQFIPKSACALRVWSCLLLLLCSPAAAQNVASQMGNTKLAVVDYRQLPLRAALRVFSEQTGMNVVPSTTAAEVNISLFLRNVRAIDALKTLTKTHGLFFRDAPESGITTVYTNDELQSNLQTFREEETRVFTMLYPNAINTAQAIADLYGTRVVLSYGANPSIAFQDLTERFDRFDLIDGRSQGLGLFGGGGGFGGCRLDAEPQGGGGVRAEV